MAHSTFRLGPLLLVGVALAAACLAGAAHAAAGTVQTQTGSSTVLRDGATLPLLQGQSVEAGDTVETGADGRLALTMSSGETLELKPATRFQIERYMAPRSLSEPGSGVSFYSLLRGGLRAVTRSLGQRDLDSYRMNTPVATLGIRGTIYELVMVEDGGLYAYVEEGLISLANAAGALEVQAGQYVYIAGPNVAPKLLDGRPPMFEVPGGVAGGPQARVKASPLDASVGTAAALAALVGVVINAQGGDDAESASPTTGTSSTTTTGTTTSASP